jgi:hypothetical protein
MGKAMLTYAGGRKKVEAGELTEDLFKQMQDQGLIGPSPVEERIAMFPTGLQGAVGDLFRQVETFNSDSEGLQLRLQVVQGKQAKETSE